VDASMMFNGQANLTRLAQDASRQFAIGRLTSVAATKQYILDRMGKSANAPRTQVVVDPGAADGIIRTQITVDAGYFMAVGFFDALDHIQLVVRSEHMRES